MTESAYRVRTPFFPPYSEVRQLLRTFEGVSKSVVAKTIQDLKNQTGTPQDPVDWTDPDTWIEERLSGEPAQLANRVWAESGGEINPRYLDGSFFFITRYDLLETDSYGVFRLSERGRRFLDEDFRTLAALDRAEGVDELLSIVATKTRAMRGDLLPEWGAFLKEHSTFGSSSTIKDTLRRRIVHLLDRGFISRDGNSYSISAQGLEYLERLQVTGRSDPRRDVNRALSRYNETQRQHLRDRLEVMDPLLFERLVRDLLEAMGYEDVQVTKQSGDKGVDVTGTVQLGITAVKEVVQVKRQKGSVGRPILDQLRGALPYHDAIRGTIITIGTFSKGCEEAALFQGAAPITLIDGERLIDLLIEHEVAIQRKTLSLVELDERFFAIGDEGLSQDGESEPPLA